MQGMEGEAVVYHRETRHNAADAVRSARPEGKECRLLKGVTKTILSAIITSEEKERAGLNRLIVNI